MQCRLTAAPSTAFQLKPSKNLLQHRSLGRPNATTPASEVCEVAAAPAALEATLLAASVTLDNLLLALEATIVLEASVLVVDAGFPLLGGSRVSVLCAELAATPPAITVAEVIVVLPPNSPGSLSSGNLVVITTKLVEPETGTEVMEAEFEIGKVLIDVTAVAPDV
jgi:hypothetical protein